MWIYEILTGNLYRDGIDLLGKGYSGHPPYVNQPAAQALPDRGPIPEGFYSITPPRDTEHGPYTLGLVPHHDSSCYHRSGFLIHGDKVDAPGRQLASHGCIIMSRDVREAVWNSSDHILKVVSGQIQPTEKGATQ
jgi:hypothetical protein